MRNESLDIIIYINRGIKKIKVVDILKNICRIINEGNKYNKGKKEPQ